VWILQWSYGYQNPGKEGLGGLFWGQKKERTGIFIRPLCFWKEPNIVILREQILRVVRDALTYNIIIYDYIHIFITLLC
jgi:hypothetical protein